MDTAALREKRELPRLFFTPRFFHRYVGIPVNLPNFLTHAQWNCRQGNVQITLDETGDGKVLRAIWDALPRC